MPRNTREWCIRKLEMIRTHFNTAGAYMSEIDDIYHEHHPEISQTLRDAMTALNLLDTMIERLRDNI